MAIEMKEIVKVGAFTGGQKRFLEFYWNWYC
jgi:hypothetical protein